MRSLNAQVPADSGSERVLLAHSVASIVNAPARLLCGVCMAAALPKRCADTCHTACCCRCACAVCLSQVGAADLITDLELVDINYDGSHDVVLSTIAMASASA